MGQLRLSFRRYWDSIHQMSRERKRVFLKGDTHFALRGIYTILYTRFHTYKNHFFYKGSHTGGIYVIFFMGLATVLSYIKSSSSPRLQ